jgi:hypothetical protein
MGNYLIQHSCGYVFRMEIPADLRPAIGKRELQYSLANAAFSMPNGKLTAYRPKSRDYSQSSGREERTNRCH